MFSFKIKNKCSNVWAIFFLVFKIIGIEENGFKEKANLRVGRINLNFSITDVQWHPHEGEIMYNHDYVLCMKKNYIKSLSGT